MGGLKKLLDYLTQQGFKYSPLGAMSVAYEKGDDLIDLITRGEIEKAGELFKQTYKNM